MSCDEVEEEIDKTFPMDMSIVLEEHLSWTVVGFSRATWARQFQQAKDLPSPFVSYSHLIPDVSRRY